MSSPTTAPTIHTAPRTDVAQERGGFRIYLNFPGRNHPHHDDHGYGPLATVVESFMDPDTLISMHPHRNEEIVSWVPAGVMRHDDGDGNELVTDADHLMAMGAGTGFWHEERTLASDPPLRMLQIFVRPHSLGLEPTIQHEPLPDPTPGEWRHCFGPTGSDAPVVVRNAVHCHDVRLPAGETVALPTRPDWATYCYVFEGGATIGDAHLAETESALVVDGEPTVTADEDGVLVAFEIDPSAPVTRQGTVGR